jgi:hypothetical protein
MINTYSIMTAKLQYPTNIIEPYPPYLLTPNSTKLGTDGPWLSGNFIKK